MTDPPASVGASLPAPIAYLDRQRQLVVMDPDGRQRRLTEPDDVLWATWGQAEPGDVHSWPAWSPEGRRIAAFRVGRDGSDPRPVVVDAAGVWASEGAPLEGRIPIYLQWSREGDAVAILSQGDDELILERLDARSPDRSRPMLRGSPLFFSWLAGGRIAAYVGERTGPAMIVLGPTGERTGLPGVPGNFCAPVELGDELVYVAHHRGRVAILVAGPDGIGTRELELVDGLVALVPSPDGQTIARAVAPDGEIASAYRDLRLLNVATGTTRRVSDADCVAFFFAGDHLVVARKHNQRKTIAWMRVSPDGRDEALIVELHPSRDLQFWLRYFDQYCLSHPVLSPDGSTLVLSGNLAGSADPKGPPRLWAVRVAGGDPVELDVGPFATFPPPPPTLDA